MDKIEHIEKELNHWKASVKSYSEKGKKTEAVFSGGVVHGLELAIAIAQKQYNAQIQAGACKCKYPYPDTISTFAGLVCCACLLPRR